MKKMKFTNHWMVLANTHTMIDIENNDDLYILI